MLCVCLDTWLVSVVCLLWSSLCIVSCLCISVYQDGWFQAGPMESVSGSVAVMY